ncbi:MAG: hypothetical protein IT283_06615, partial [Bacteroidetes bacterium]|nr:hypothetical protein [Bacteroidota bacterium]
GNTNDIGAATHATVGGGNDNNIASGGNYSSILGGNTNDIGTATHATVGGGNDNNIASGANYGAVTGGASNNINGGTHNFIGGGESNTITTGNWNAVLGGKSNTVVSGNYSGILGGLNNTATGDLAFALGTGNTAAANGFALGNTSTAVANEFSATYSAGFKFVGEGTANKNFTATFINRSTNTQATPLQGDYSGDATPTGPANGIAIQLMPTATNISNDYIRFINGSNAVVGRIEGQSVADLLSDSEHLHFLRELDYAIDNAEGEIVSAGIALGFAIADGVIGSAEIIQSSLDEGGRIVCGGATLGGCASIAATGAVDVILKVANVVMYAANIAVAAVDLNDAIEGKKDAEQLKCSYDTMVANNIGVTYESGSADYAEWLPKSNLSEKFGISDIVGVRGGKISKNTDGAEQFMVVSMKPIVLGNTPAEGKAQDYEKVAFMGQVPVRVLGPVKLGDYILPSDGGNGLGIAVAPSNMRVEDYKKIVGVAWSAGSNPDLNTVRVAVGLNTNSLATMIEKQNSEMLAMKESMSQMNSALASLVPGYSKMMNVPASSPVQNSADYLDKIFSSLNAGQSLPPVTNTSITSVADGKPISDISVPSTFFNDDVMSKAFADAQAAFVKGGGDVSTHPFFSKVAYDPAFREIAMRKIQNQLNKAAFDQMIQNASANAVKK